MKPPKRYLALLVFTIAAGTTILAAAPAKKEPTSAAPPAMTPARTPSDVKGTLTGEAVPLIPTNAQRSPVVAPTAPAVTASTPSANFTINWFSVNGGGTTNASSTNYSMGSSVGQSAAGQASSPNFQVGIGFWYGAAPEGCSCPHQGDLVQSGFIDVSDVLKVISIAFVNGADIQDPQCPKTRADVNNSGFVDVNDVLYIIKTAFVNGPPPIDPCVP